MEANRANQQPSLNQICPLSKKNKHTHKKTARKFKKGRDTQTLTDAQSSRVHIVRPAKAFVPSDEVERVGKAASACVRRTREQRRSCPYQDTRRRQHCLLWLRLHCRARVTFCTMAIVELLTRQTQPRSAVQLVVPAV